MQTRKVEQRPNRAGGARGGSMAPGYAMGSTQENERPKSRVKIPAYLRIADEIGGRIARGEYRPGDRLPSEAQFCDEFEVAPMTLRRALGVLVDGGVVETEQGRGTFVRTPTIGEATFSLAQGGGLWLGDVDVRLLAASTVPATPRVAEVLATSPGDRTVYLRRLILKSGVPIMYHTEYVIFDPRRPLVESQLTITSLAGLLQTAGAEDTYPRGRLTVRAVNLDAETADLLGELPGAAAFCLEHIFEDHVGRPVSWGWFLCRADEFFLETRLGNLSIGPNAAGGPAADAP